MTNCTPYNPRLSSPLGILPKECSLHLLKHHVVADASLSLSIYTNCDKHRARVDVMILAILEIGRFTEQIRHFDVAPVRPERMNVLIER